MVQEADGQGKPAIQMPLKSSNGQDFSPEVASPSADVEHPRFLKSKKTGLSFRVLQWLTETDDLDDDEIVMEDIDSRHTVDILFTKPIFMDDPDAQAFLHSVLYFHRSFFSLFRGLNIFLFDSHPIKIARMPLLLITLAQDSSIRFG